MSSVSSKQATDSAATDSEIASIQPNRIKNRRLRRELGVVTSKRSTTDGLTFAECVEELMIRVREERDKRIEELRSDDILKFQQQTFCGCAANGKFRKRVTDIVRSSTFQAIILVLIILNTIGLALYDPMDNTSSTQWNQVLDVVDNVFNVMFTIELVLKIIAIGFISWEPPAWAMEMSKGKTNAHNASLNKRHKAEDAAANAAKSAAVSNGAMSPMSKSRLSPTKGRMSPMNLESRTRAARTHKKDTIVVSSSSLFGIGNSKLDSCCCGIYLSGLCLGGWNLLDLFVVVFAWFVFILEGLVPGMPTSLTSLRGKKSRKLFYFFVIFLLIVIEPVYLVNYKY